jgi:hypothetical protein
MDQDWPSSFSRPLLLFSTAHHLPDTTIVYLRWTEKQLNPSFGLLSEILLTIGSFEAKNLDIAGSHLENLKIVT